MRELTFAGFLKSYVRELSEADTNSLYTLAREAAHNNPRLREPLLLYALFTEKEAVLLRAAKDPRLLEAYRRILAQYNKETMQSALEEDSSELEEAYRKVWRSYLQRKDRHTVDNETKELMRQRILALQEEKSVSNYRIYSELGLNPGNVNAWLKHGASNKISLDTARRALRFVDRQL